MKNRIDVDGIEPVSDTVLVKVVPIPNRTKSGLVESTNKAFTGEYVINYMGKVVDIGPDVKQVSIGEYVLFSMLSGQKILAKDDGDFKIVEESGLLVYSKMSGMKVENVEPIGDRLLVNIKEEFVQEKTESGVIVSTSKSEGDAKERDLTRAEILSVPEEFSDKFNVGDVVYFEAGMGLSIDELKGAGDYWVIRPMYIKMKYKK